jgi:hypothetical protein
LEILKGRERSRFRIKKANENNMDNKGGIDTGNKRKKEAKTFGELCCQMCGTS